MTRSRLLALLLVWVAAITAVSAQQQAAADEWLVVDYRRLVDLRQLTHSGEPMEVVLNRLAGRPLPAPGANPQDRTDHTLIEPILETYGFLLIDALDALTPAAPRVELGSLWMSGEAQPAWVELLRSRRYIVESDGKGGLRLILPYVGGRESAEAARGALAAAWPVVRHAVAAEQRRLQRGDGLPELELQVFTYFHDTANATFRVGSIPHIERVSDTGRRGGTPFDARVFLRFLESGWRLEGARLSEDGTLSLLGSESDETATILGEPMTLADLAVAQRAVFHGGLAEPYMSLDRSQSPQTAWVNYGGRLRDTRLGWVSLLCDIRFKTFSQGLGLYEDTDLRDSIRARIPGFRTHLERFAADERASDVNSQQTRLWFYPDKVDLTVSPQGDVLVLRNVRMSAASERVAEATQAGEQTQAPWTLQTVADVDARYDALAGLFPELHDLDRAVSLLALFTWLKQLSDAGRTIPDVDALLDVELPPAPTPRDYPRLLAFNALPAAGSGNSVEVFDRVEIAEALERLRPSYGRLDPGQRLERALDGLDASVPQHATFMSEVREADLQGAGPGIVDLLAHRAERLRMHNTVLKTLPEEHRQSLVERQRGGEALRVFSVGIGGIDLGMGRVIRRASGRSSGLGWGRAAIGAAPSAPVVTRRAAPKAPPAGDGAAVAVADSIGMPRGITMRPHAEGTPEGVAVLFPDAPEGRARELWRKPDGTVDTVQRWEGERLLRYRFDARKSVLRVIPQPVPGPLDLAEPPLLPRSVPPATVLMTLLPPDQPDAEPTEDLPLRLVAQVNGEVVDRFGSYPRRILERAVLGPSALPPGARALPGLNPLPTTLGQAEHMLIRLQPEQRYAPWIGDRPGRAGEENPLQLARGLRDWWREEGPTVALFRDDASLGSWTGAPRPTSKALLILPEEGFAAPFSELRAEIAAAWPGPVASTLPKKLPETVVLVSAEDPGVVSGRLARMAARSEMKGKLLAGWSLLGPLREDLPARLLGSGIAGFGLASGNAGDLRRAPELLGRFGTALPKKGERRVEAYPGPFVWIY